MSGKKVYAVRKGFMPGIYYEWKECKKQVNRFSRAKYKDFKNLAEVEVWLTYHS
jgi:viroplasmin and RNaseH domain-containing protein